MKWDLPSVAPVVGQPFTMTTELTSTTDVAKLLEPQRETPVFLIRNIQHDTASDRWHVDIVYIRSGDQPLPTLIANEAPQTIHVASLPALAEVDLKKVSKEMRTSPSPLGFALPKEVYVFIGLAAVLIIGATVFYGIKWTRARRRGADEILTVAKIKKTLTKALQNAGEWRRTAFLCSELLRRYAFKQTLYPFVDTTTAEAERDIARWAVNLPKNVSDKQLLGLLNHLDELKFSPENLLSETQRQSINDLTQQAIQWMQNYDDAVQRNQTQPS